MNTTNSNAAFDASYGVNKAEILQLVQEEMQVFDSTDSFVGKVGEVQFGANVDANAPGAGPATPARGTDPGDGSLIEVLRDAFTGHGDGERSELIERLRQSGFIRLAGSGLLRGRRYILPEQIDYVDSEGVHLNVVGDKLLAD